MAKLTRAQERDLQNAMYHLERGIAYLRHPKTAVCYRSNYPATTTSDYSSSDGKTSLTPVCIDYGSDIVGLYDALNIVKSFLREHRRTS
ncbi:MULTISPECIES: hypothetical protein [Klebsiella pneumoniae complex]|uniref:hypothetical protein n=1 Tax=Klebsiella pneumoniae complex TaxID=3390273 RepID=UPI0021528A4C|nr:MULTISPECIES: hypothetical protein [Klebsiella]MDL4414110.1 hypothetical protein [Klebsiella variicola]HCB0356573.1 hypothetical protein [Klebsiella variicola subsp. variicola]HCD3514448.1 hypothetical protein [Klebsiella pneumoniae]HEN1638202.1 hypothetical protein [Klebsiella pneumoniae]